jgi:two-component system, NarL family, sensor histidine kinase UhpB
VRIIKTISPSLRLALIYLIFSVLWILLSDEIVVRIANHNIAVVNQLQTIKGIAFVLSSGALLFFSSLHIYKNLHSTLLNKEELLDKLNALSEAAREGLIDHNIETDIAVVNDEMKSLLGVDSSVIRNFSFLHNMHIHPDDRSRVNEHLQHFLEGKTMLWQWEYRYACNGSYKDIVSRGCVIRDKKTQKPLKVIYALQDVTEIRDTRTKYYQQQVAFRQSLSRTMIESEEKEKNRWSQELHDNVGQLLTVAKLYTEEALRNYDDPFIRKSQTMIEKAIDDIRHISSSIKPPEFSTISLYEAIEGLIENIKRFVAFDFTIEYDQEIELALSAEQKLMVYRIVQEQLNNITKYADASNVSLNIAVSNKQVSIIIKDDGKGFNPTMVKAGIGLKNISGRLQLFSGDLNINSSPGKGCELKAHFHIDGNK